MTGQFASKPCEACGGSGAMDAGHGYNLYATEYVACDCCRGKGVEGPRIIVCGGRDYTDSDRVRVVLSECLPHDPVIVHGGASGADHEAEAFALSNELLCQVFPADWEAHRGKRPNPAGFIRNEEMASAGAALCIAFPGGGGTRDMVRRATSHGIAVRKVDW